MNITEKDIRAKYKKETGEYVPYFDETEDSIVNYIEWLEQQIIELEKVNFNLTLESNQRNWNKMH